MTADDPKKPVSVNRRRFLAGAVGAAGAVAAGGAVAGAPGAAGGDGGLCKNAGCDYDVIVIGGGFAGTTAARDCKENGYKTLLLEARNRLGGRTFTAPFGNDHIEMGGTWVHWTQPNVWAEIERYGLEVVETPGFVPDVNIACIDGQRQLLSEADMDSLTKAFEAFMQGSRQIWERPYNVKFTWDKVLEADRISVADKLDAMKLPRFQHNIMKGFIACLAHNLTDKMSYAEALRWMSCPGFNDVPIFFDSIGRYKFKDGTVSLIDAMVADARPEIKLSTVVKRIEDLGDKVRVTTEAGKEYLAATVISTLPMNVIGSVEFNPPLDPLVIKAGKERHTGNGIKVYAKTTKPIGKVLMFGGEADPLANAFTYTEGPDFSLIVGFGNQPDSLDVHDRRAVQAALARFIPEIEITEVRGYDWNLDPYALGTYCSYKPGWMNEYYDHFQKDMGRIVFGSGDHGEGWRGFIDGAIREGAKAADRVQKRLA